MAQRQTAKSHSATRAGFALVMALFTAGPVWADPFVFERRELADGVHVVYRPDASREPVEGNVLVIEQSEGLVVFDAGGTPLSGRRIVEQIRAISDQPVRQVVISHWHGDHHLGLPALRDAWPDLTVIAHEKTAAYMSGPQMDYLEGMTPEVLNQSSEGLAGYLESEASAAMPDGLRQRAEMMVEDLALAAVAAAEITVTAADRSIGDSLHLDDPERPVMLLHPGIGNTDGDLVAWLPEQGILATGDLVVAPTPYGFGSPPLEWAQTLEGLAELPFTTLVPGHGEVMQDRVYLDRLIALLRFVGAEAERLNGDGLDAETVAATIDWSAAIAEFAGNDPWLQRSFRNYFQTPIIGHVLQEARGETIAQGGE